MSTAAILDPLLTSSLVADDGLRLASLPFVPQVRLHLANDAVVLRARLETLAGRALPPPFWADAWAGGQAVARFILENPEVVAGRRVLDVASGSGVGAIAAALAGAAAVTANDIDPYALAAITLNARANDVAVDVRAGDVLAGAGGDADVVLAGDVFYDREFAGRMMGFLDRAVARGASVLVGDPGRGHLPYDRFQVVAGYPVTRLGAFVDAQNTSVQVLRPIPAAATPASATGH